MKLAILNTFISQIPNVLATCKKNSMWLIGYGQKEPYDNNDIQICLFTKISQRIDEIMILVYEMLNGNYFKIRKW